MSWIGLHSMDLTDPIVGYEANGIPKTRARELRGLLQRFVLMHPQVDREMARLYRSTVRGYNWRTLEADEPEPQEPRKPATEVPSRPYIDDWCFYVDEAGKVSRSQFPEILQSDKFLAGRVGDFGPCVFSSIPGMKMWWSRFFVVGEFIKMQGFDLPAFAKDAAAGIDAETSTLTVLVVKVIVSPGNDRAVCFEAWGIGVPAETAVQ